MKVVILVVFLGTAIAGDPFMSCGSSKHGLITSDPDDCRNYLQCDNGELLRKICPEGFYFSPTHDQCILNNGECLVDYDKSCGSLLNGDFAADESNCVNFFLCSSGKLKFLSCPDGQYFSARTMRCMEDDGTCAYAQAKPRILTQNSCGQYSNGAKVTNDVDCTRYAFCSNGMLIPQQCPNGEYFSQYHGDCVPDDGTCNVKPKAAARQANCTYDCGDLPNGLRKADEQNCAKFFVCSNGNLMHMTCENGKYFNNTIKRCIDADGTCKDVTPTIKPPLQNCTCGLYPNGEKYPDPNNCTAYFICCNGQAMHQYCDSGFYFNPLACSCMPDNGACGGVLPELGKCGNYSDGQFIPDHDDCASFFICIRGEMRKQTCPAGMMFDINEEGCVLDVNGECDTTQTTTPPPITPPFDCEGHLNGQTWKDDADCRSYYQCVNDEIIHQTCKTGDYYNETLSQCIIDNGQCVCQPPPENCGCGNYSNGEFFPNEENCVRFFTCSFNKILSLSCPDGQYFNRTYLRCIKDDGTCDQVIPTVPPVSCCGELGNGETKPDPSNCLKYSMCCNGQLISQQCRDGFYYNGTEGQCLPDNGNCIDGGENQEDVCLNVRTGTFFPNNTDCNSYILCCDGKSLGLTCRPGYYYDEGQRTCVQGECTNTNGPNPTLAPPLEGLNCDNYKDGDLIPNDDDCQSFSICCNGVIIPVQCPTGYFDREHNTCIDNPNVCNWTPDRCYQEDDGKFVEGNCTNYWVCCNGKSIHLTCRDGYYFNSALETCVLDEDGICNEIYTTTPPPPKGENCILDDTTYEDGEFIPDLEDCTRYKICCNGKIIEKQCLEGMFYNVNERVCMFDYDNECLATTPTPTPTETTETTDGPPLIFPPTCVGKENGEVIEDLACDKYGVCCDDKIITVSCPTGFYFDKAVKVCVKNDGSCNPISTNCMDLEDGAILAIPNACDVYAVCCEGQAVNVRCPAGHYFERQIKICVPNYGECKTAAIFGVPTSSTPSPIITITTSQPAYLVNCTGVPDGASIEVPYDCQDYAVCQNEHAIIIPCAPGLYYDAKWKMCNIDYGQCKTTTPQYTISSLPTSTSISVADPFEVDCFGREDGESVEIPNECRKYAICCEGRGIVISCPIGYFYSHSNEGCYRGDCDDSTVTPPITQSPPPTETTEETTTDATPLRCAVDNLMIPDPNDCQGYYICLDGLFHYGLCGDSTYFSNGECVLDNGECKGKRCQCGGGLENGNLTSDPTDCSRYLLCCNCQMMILHCPAGKYFDQSVNDCVADTRGVCFDPNPAPDNVNCGQYSNGTTIANIDDCERYFTCTDGRISPKTCPPGAYFDKAQMKCMTGNCHIPSTIKPPPAQLCSTYSYGTYIPDPTDCASYYICYNSSPLRQTCPAGQYFEPSSRVCSLDRGQCNSNSSEISPGTPALCYGRHGVMLGHETDCRRFYICANGETIPYQCKFGKFFNVTTSRCEVDCKNQCTPTAISSRNSVHENSIIDHVNCTDLPEGSVLDDPQDCSHYFICSNGYPIPTKCPQQYYFHRVAQICIPDMGTCKPIATDTALSARRSLRMIDDSACQGLHGITLADSEDCSKFYVCSYGKIASHETCNDGEYFDKLTLQCSQNTGHCIIRTNGPSKICDGKVEGAYLADPENCAKFIMCTDAAAIPQKCQNGEFFDSVHRYCRVNDGSCTVSSEDVEELERNPCHKQHGVFVADKRCDRYHLCVNGQSAAINHCKPGFYYDKSVRTCVHDGDEVCSVTEDGEGNALPTCSNLSRRKFYANTLDDCRTFFKCADNAAQLFTCPNGLVFNALLQTCDNPEFTICIESGTKIQNISCVDQITGVRYPNIDNGCRSFVICAHGDLIEKDCTAGMLYNDELDVCDWPTNVQCGEVDEEAKEAQRERHAIRQRSNGIDDNICAVLDEKRFFGNREDECRSFFECLDNAVQMFACPLGLMFNSLKNACDYPQDSLCYDENGEAVHSPPCMGDTTDKLYANLRTGCQSYFICDNNQPLEQFCPIGMLFNAKAKACDWPANVRCEATHDEARRKRNVIAEVNTLPSCQDLEENKFYGLPDDRCKSFFQCVEGHAFVSACPTGLVFNSLKNQCDFPQFSQCKGPDGALIQQPQCLGEPTGTLHENLLNGCQSFFVCDNDTPFEQFCQEGMLFNIKNKACDWVQNVRCGMHDSDRRKRSVAARHPMINCAGLEPNLFYGLIQNNCRSFFQCVGNEAFVTDCPDGLIFNSLKKQCDYPQFSRCEGPNGVIVKQPQCVGLPTGILIDNLLNGCQSYFVCDNDKPVERFCQAGMLFNAEAKACDWPKNVQCGARNRNRRSADQQFKIPNCQNLVQNKFFGIVEDNCQSFYQCVDGRAYVNTCPEGLVFNSLKKQCDYPENSICSGPGIRDFKQPDCVGVASGTLIKNILNGCRSYFICDNDRSIEQSCQDGMLFNAEAKTCDWSQNVRCGPLDRKKRSLSDELTPNCDGLAENQFYGLAEDSCQSFFQCIDGHPFVGICPAGTMFNSLRNLCDYPPNSKCLGPDGKEIKQPPCLGRETGEQLPNYDTDCRSFFTCNDNHAIEVHCQDGMLFNSKIGVCDWPHNVQCSKMEADQEQSADEDTQQHSTLYRSASGFLRKILSV